MNRGIKLPCVQIFSQISDHDILKKIDNYVLTMHFWNSKVRSWESAYSNWLFEIVFQKKFNSCKIRACLKKACFFSCEAILNLVFRRKPIGIFGGLDVLTATERTHVCKNTYKLKKLNRRFIDRQNCGRSAAICTPRKRSNNSSINIFRSKSVLGRSKTKNDDKKSANFPNKIRYTD